jgi:EAL domain-containing protein (putative c-di-GMP-specific phosphodiesterase class I)
VVRMAIIKSRLRQNKGIEHAYHSMWMLENWKVMGYEALLTSPDGSLNQNLEQGFNQVGIVGDLYKLNTLSISRAVSHFPFQRTRSELLFVHIFLSTLMNEQFQLFIHFLKKRYPQAAGKIVFEIIDTKDEEHMWKNPKVKTQIRFIKDNGFYIAINDGDKETASVEKMIEFSPDYIKLGSYFSKDLHLSIKKQKMLSLLIRHSNQNMTLILKDIENEMVLAIAKALHVPVAQGLLLGKPKSFN